MNEKVKHEVWVSWVCRPHMEPYLGCLVSDTIERAEASFCELDGKRCRLFADCKIIHQKMTIEAPPEVCAEFDKWKKGKLR